MKWKEKAEAPMFCLETPKQYLFLGFTSAAVLYRSFAPKEKTVDPCIRNWNAICEQRPQNQIKSLDDLVNKQLDILKLAIFVKTCLAENGWFEKCTSAAE